MAAMLSRPRAVIEGDDMRAVAHTHQDRADFEPAAFIFRMLRTPRPHRHGKDKHIRGALHALSGKMRSRSSGSSAASMFISPS